MKTHNRVNSAEKSLKPATSQSHKRVKSKDVVQALSHTNFSDKLFNLNTKKHSSTNTKKNISLKS